MNNSVMLFKPSSGSWSISLPVSLYSNSSLDFSSGITSTGNFVGINHTAWESIAQRLGASSVNITLPTTGSDLYKCDDSGANCLKVTSLAVLQSTNATAGTSLWTIPMTLGFSTYTTTAPSSGTSSSSNSNAGCAGCTSQLQSPTTSSAITISQTTTPTSSTSQQAPVSTSTTTTPSSSLVRVSYSMVAIVAVLFVVFVAILHFVKVKNYI